MTLARDPKHVFVYKFPLRSPVWHLLAKVSKALFSFFGQHNPYEHTRKRRTRKRNGCGIMAGAPCLWNPDCGILVCGIIAVESAGPLGATRLLRQEKPVLAREREARLNLRNFKACWRMSERALTYIKTDQNKPD